MFYKKRLRRGPPLPNFKFNIVQLQYYTMSSAFLEVFSFRYSESIYTFPTAGRIIYHLSSPDIQNLFTPSVLLVESSIT